MHLSGRSASCGISRVALSDGFLRWKTIASLNADLNEREGSDERLEVDLLVRKALTTLSFYLIAREWSDDDSMLVLDYLW
jgi:hypothetical protein